MIYCSQCGSPSEDGTQFCGECGFAFVIPQQAPQFQSPPQATYPPPPVTPQPVYPVQPMPQQPDLAAQMTANPVKVLAICVTALAFVSLIPFIYGIVEEKLFSYLSGFRLFIVVLQVIIFLCILVVGIILIMKPDSNTLSQSGYNAGAYQPQVPVQYAAVQQQPFQAPAMQPAPQVQQGTNAVPSLAEQPQQNQQPGPAYPVQQNVIVMGKAKSVGVAFLLAFLFGPLGLLYASIIGGVVMFFVSIVLFFVIPVVGYILAWVMCIIWALIAANQANSNLHNKAGNLINNNFQR